MNNYPNSTQPINNFSELSQMPSSNTLATFALASVLNKDYQNPSIKWDQGADKQMHTDSYFENFNFNDQNMFTLDSSRKILDINPDKECPYSPELNQRYSTEDILSPLKPRLSSEDHPNYQLAKGSESASTQESSPEREIPSELDEDRSHYTLKSHPISSGFPNLGNTCYMNSILQCLFNTEALEISLAKNKDFIEKSPSSLTNKFIEALSSAFAKPSGAKNMSVPLFQFKRALEKVVPMFKGYAQHDAHEFFSLLLEKMHDELNNAPKKSRPYMDFDVLTQNKQLCEIAEEWEKYSQEKDDSLLKSIFGGMLLTEVRCSHCNHISYKFEDSLDLSLNIANLNTDASSSASSDASSDSGTTSLYTCLKDFVRPEFLEGYACDKCKRKDTSSKRTLLWKQPEVLVVQLKRFVYDLYGEREAVKDDVSFPLENLRLDHFTHEESNEDKGKYKLYGIVNHFGDLESGHYIAFVYNEYQRCWLQYNDNQVSTIDEEDIEEFAKGSSEPYILFYKRV